MAGFVKQMMGNDGMVNAFASGAGEAVEGFVKDVGNKMTGGAAVDQKEGAASDMVGTVMKVVSGGQDDNKGGAGNIMNTVMSAVSGEDKNEGGAGNIMNTVMSAVSGGDDKNEGEGGLSKFVGGLL